MFYSLQTELLAQLKQEEREMELAQRALHRLREEPTTARSQPIRTALYETGRFLSRTGNWIERISKPRPAAIEQRPAQECC